MRAQPEGEREFRSRRFPTSHRSSDRFGPEGTHRAQRLSGVLGRYEAENRIADKHGRPMSSDSWPCLSEADPASVPRTMTSMQAEVQQRRLRLVATHLVAL